VGSGNLGAHQPRFEAGGREAGGREAGAELVQSCVVAVGDQREDDDQGGREAVRREPS